MSLLVILLPPRPRGDAAAAAPTEYAWALAGAAGGITKQGSDPAAQLPHADQVCALLADADVAWHRITLPKAPAARLRDALGAVLEDQLLDDPDNVHLALEAGVAAGQQAWVAAVHKGWLQTLLSDLEAAGVELQRLLPPAWPEAAPHLHVMPGPFEGSTPMGVLSQAEGVARFGLAGTLGRQQLARLPSGPLACSSHPAVAAAAERWLGAPVAVLADADRALQAARSPWNLRQFDLAVRHRGLRAITAGLRRLTAPEWRPVRLGLAALLLVQLAGLNAWAWHLERKAAGRRQAMTQLLQATHPQVRSVLDAPLQMQRETERLRAAAGRPGPADLEPMLAAAASAWPDGQPPLRALKFDSGRLTVVTVGWGDAQRAAFAQRARAAGYQAEAKAEQVVLTPTER